MFNNYNETPPISYSNDYDQEGNKKQENPSKWSCGNSDGVQSHNYSSRKPEYWSNNTNILGMPASLRAPPKFNCSECFSSENNSSYQCDSDRNRSWLPKRIPVSVNGFCESSKLPATTSRWNNYSFNNQDSCLIEGDAFAQGNASDGKKPHFGRPFQGSAAPEYHEPGVIASAKPPAPTDRSFLLKEKSGFLSNSAAQEIGYCGQNNVRPSVFCKSSYDSIRNFNNKLESRSCDSNVCDFTENYSRVNIYRHQNDVNPYAFDAHFSRAPFSNPYGKSVPLGSTQNRVPLAGHRSFYENLSKACKDKTLIGPNDCSKKVLGSEECRVNREVTDRLVFQPSAGNVRLEPLPRELPSLVAAADVKSSQFLVDYSHFNVNRDSPKHNENAAEPDLQKKFLFERNIHMDQPFSQNNFSNALKKSHQVYIPETKKDCKLNQTHQMNYADQQYSGFTGMASNSGTSKYVDGSTLKTSVSAFHQKREPKFEKVLKPDKCEALQENLHLIQRNGQSENDRNVHACLTRPTMIYNDMQDFRIPNRMQNSFSYSGDSGAGRNHIPSSHPFRNRNMASQCDQSPDSLSSNGFAISDEGYLNRGILSRAMTMAGPYNRSFASCGNNAFIYNSYGPFSENPEKPHVEQLYASADPRAPSGVNIRYSGASQVYAEKPLGNERLPDRKKDTYLEAIKGQDLNRNGNSKISPLRLLRKKKFNSQTDESVSKSPAPAAHSVEASPALDVRKFWSTWADEEEEEEEENSTSTQMVVLDCQNINPEQAELLQFYDNDSFENFHCENDEGTASNHSASDKKACNALNRFDEIDKQMILNDRGFSPSIEMKICDFEKESNNNDDGQLHATDEIGKADSVKLIKDGLIEACSKTLKNDSISLPAIEPASLNIPENVEEMPLGPKSDICGAEVHGDFNEKFDFLKVTDLKREWGVTPAPEKIRLDEKENFFDEESSAKTICSDVEKEIAANIKQGEVTKESLPGELAGRPLFFPCIEISAENSAKAMSNKNEGEKLSTVVDYESKKISSFKEKSDFSKLPTLKSRRNKFVDYSDGKFNGKKKETRCTEEVKILKLEEIQEPGLEKDGESSATENCDAPIFSECQLSKGEKKLKQECFISFGKKDFQRSDGESVIINDQVKPKEETGLRNFEMNGILQKLSKINFSHSDVKVENAAGTVYGQPEKVTEVSEAIVPGKKFKKSKKTEFRHEKKERTEKLTVENISSSNPTIKFSIQKSHDLKISFKVLNNQISGIAENEGEEIENVRVAPDESGKNSTELITLRLKSFQKEGDQGREKPNTPNILRNVRKNESERKSKTRFKMRKKSVENLLPGCAKAPATKIKRSECLHSAKEEHEGCWEYGARDDMEKSVVGMIDCEVDNLWDARRKNLFQVKESTDSAKIKLTFKRQKRHSEKEAEVCTFGNDSKEDFEYSRAGQSSGAEGSEGDDDQEKGDQRVSFSPMDPLSSARSGVRPEAKREEGFIIANGSESESVPVEHVDSPREHSSALKTRLAHDTKGNPVKYSKCQLDKHSECSISKRTCQNFEKIRNIFRQKHSEEKLKDNGKNESRFKIVENLDAGQTFKKHKSILRENLPEDHRNENECVEKNLSNFRIESESAGSFSSKDPLLVSVLSGCAEKTDFMNAGIEQPEICPSHLRPETQSEMLMAVKAPESFAASNEITRSPANYENSKLEEPINMNRRFDDKIEMHKNYNNEESGPSNSDSKRKIESDRLLGNDANFSCVKNEEKNDSKILHGNDACLKEKIWFDDSNNDIFKDDPLFESDEPFPVPDKGARSGVLEKRWPEPYRGVCTEEDRENGCEDFINAADKIKAIQREKSHGSILNEDSKFDELGEAFEAIFQESPANISNRTNEKPERFETMTCQKVSQKVRDVTEKPSALKNNGSSDDDNADENLEEKGYFYFDDLVEPVIKDDRIEMPKSKCSTVACQKKGTLEIAPEKERHEEKTISASPSDKIKKKHFSFSSDENPEGFKPRESKSTGSVASEPEIECSRREIDDFAGSSFEEAIGTSAFENASFTRANENVISDVEPQSSRKRESLSIGNDSETLKPRNRGKSIGGKKEKSQNLSAVRPNDKSAHKIFDDIRSYQPKKILRRHSHEDTDKLKSQVNIFGDKGKIWPVRSAAQITFVSSKWKFRRVKAESCPPDAPTKAAEKSSGKEILDVRVEDIPLPPGKAPAENCFDLNCYRLSKRQICSDAKSVGGLDDGTDVPMKRIERLANDSLEKEMDDSGRKSVSKKSYRLSTWQANGRNRKTEAPPLNEITEDLNNPNRISRNETNGENQKKETNFSSATANESACSDPADSVIACCETSGTKNVFSLALVSVGAPLENSTSVKAESFPENLPFTIENGSEETKEKNNEKFIEEVDKSSRNEIAKEQAVIETSMGDVQIDINEKSCCGSRGKSHAILQSDINENRLKLTSDDDDFGEEESTKFIRSENVKLAHGESTDIETGLGNLNSTTKDEFYECEDIPTSEDFPNGDMEVEKVSDDAKFRHMMQNCLENAKKFLNVNNMKLFSCSVEDLLGSDCPITNGDSNEKNPKECEKPAEGTGNLISRDVLLTSCDDIVCDVDLELPDKFPSGDVSADFIPSFGIDSLCSEILPVDNWPYLEEEVPSSPVKSHQEETDLIPFLENSSDSGVSFSGKSTSGKNLTNDLRETLSKRCLSESNINNANFRKFRQKSLASDKIGGKRRKTTDSLHEIFATSDDAETIRPKKDVEKIEQHIWPKGEDSRTTISTGQVLSDLKIRGEARFFSNSKNLKKIKTEIENKKRSDYDSPVWQPKVILRRMSKKQIRKIQERARRGEGADKKADLRNPVKNNFHEKNEISRDIVATLKSRKIISPLQYRLKRPTSSSNLNKFENIKSIDISKGEGGNNSIDSNTEDLKKNSFEALFLKRIKVSGTGENQVRTNLFSGLTHALKRKKSRFRNLHDKRHKKSCGDLTEDSVVAPATTLPCEKFASQDAEHLLSEIFKGCDEPGKQSFKSEKSMWKTADKTAKLSLTKFCRDSCSLPRMKKCENKNDVSHRRPNTCAYFTRPNESDNHGHQSGTNKPLRNSEKVFVKPRHRFALSQKSKMSTKDDDVERGERFGNRRDERKDIKGWQKERRKKNSEESQNVKENSASPSPIKEQHGFDIKAKSPFTSLKEEFEESSGDEPWMCEVCGFNEETERVTHIKNHPFHCQSCHLAFRTEARFINHLTEKHRDIRNQHHCLLCELSFDTEKQYRLHIKTREHVHLETVEKNTINTLFTLLTGQPCPLFGLAELRPEWLPNQAGTVHFYHQATPLSLALQYLKMHHDLSSYAKDSSSHSA